FRDPHDRTRPARRFAGGFLRPHDLGDADAIVFGPDIAEPMTDITAQHERISGRLAVALLVGDEGHEWHRRELDLLRRHFAELRNRDLDSVLDPLEVAA